MSLSIFEIAIVNEGLEEVWREYWRGDPSEEAMIAFEAGELSRVTVIVAQNLDSAVAEARKQNPGMSVMRAGSSEVGQ